MKSQKRKSFKPNICYMLIVLGISGGDINAQTFQINGSSIDFTSEEGTKLEFVSGAFNPSEFDLNTVFVSQATNTENGNIGLLFTSQINSVETPSQGNFGSINFNSEIISWNQFEPPSTWDFNSATEASFSGLLGRFENNPEGPYYDQVSITGSNSLTFEMRTACCRDSFWVELEQNAGGEFDFLLPIEIDLPEPPSIPGDSPTLVPSPNIEDTSLVFYDPILREWKKTENTNSLSTAHFVEELDEYIFDPNRETVVISHGWTPTFTLNYDVLDDDGDLLNKYATALSENSNQYNIVGYDWSINSLSTTVPNELTLAQALDLHYELNNLYEGTTGANDITMIGHSLGSKIVSQAFLENNRDSNGVNWIDQRAISRLVLLDSPDDTISNAFGGQVELQSTINAILDLEIDSQPFIEHYYSDNFGGFGVPYDGVLTVDLNGQWHSSVADWYANTINPDAYDISIAGTDIVKTSPHGIGFDSERTENSTNPQSYGSLILSNTYDANGNGPLSYFDEYALISDIVDEVVFTESPLFSQVINNDESSVGFYSPTGDGYVYMEEGVIKSFTGSPIYSYFDFLKTADIIGISFEFMSELFSGNDYLEVYIGDTLFASFDSRFFSDEWRNTGYLDISGLANGSYQLTLGFISDETGNNMNYQNFELLKDRRLSNVSSPPTLSLLLSFLAIVAFRVKSKSG